jgi:CYTH domain-containing protein
MSDDDVEIEYRFFIPDPTVLPPLGKGDKIIQCYLPSWKIEIVGDNLCFEGRVLKSNLTMEENRTISSMIETIQEQSARMVTPRIRLKNKDLAFVTVKGPGVLERVELEWEVAYESVQDLVTSFRFPYVEKRRYTVPEEGGLEWEIDFFEGDNDGLVMAELEVLSTDHEFVRPDWLGRDVTEDGRFGNGSLARDPWIDFRDDV